MSSETPRLQIVERDGNTVRIVGESAEGIIEIICDMEWAGETLVLQNLHADGAGPGSLGLSAIRAFAREFARQQRARIIEINGGMRTTGANPGKIPRKIRIKIKETER